MQHVIFCSDALDGIAAAAIVGRALRLHGREWKLGAVISPAEDKPLGIITQAKGDSIYLLDIHPKSLGPMKDVLAALTQHNKIAYWCSDMPCKDDAVELIRGSALAADVFADRTPFCSSELAQARFLPNDATAQMLASMARDIKLWRRSDEKALKLADAIASGYDRRQLVDSFSKGVIWSPALETARKEYLQKKEKALQDLAKHITIKDYVGIKFGFTLAANLLPSADACQHLLDTHVAIDVATVIYRDGRIVFRRRDGVNIDLEEVATLFDGGGREYASGGKIHATVSGENFEKILFNIDRTLKDHFLR